MGFVDCQYVALARQGVEIVKADSEDIGSLVAAFSGAYGVYGNTGRSFEIVFLATGLLL